MPAGPGLQRYRSTFDVLAFDVLAFDVLAFDILAVDILAVDVSGIIALALNSPKQW
jgi:hypothetical protein